MIHSGTHFPFFCELYDKSFLSNLSCAHTCSAIILELRKLFTEKLYLTFNQFLELMTPEIGEPLSFYLNCVNALPQLNQDIIKVTIYYILVICLLSI